jgi:hypothetical protein
MKVVKIEGSSSTNPEF